MLVREVMRPEVVTTKPEISVRDASKLMVDMRIGSLIVLDKEKILGIVTSTDIVKAIASGKDPENTPIEDAMSKNVKTIEPDKTIEEAVDLMVENKIRKLLVVDGEKIVGMITSSDIVIIEPKLLANIASLMTVQMSGYSGG